MLSVDEALGTTGLPDPPVLRLADVDAAAVVFVDVAAAGDAAAAGAAAPTAATRPMARTAGDVPVAAAADAS
ncbi:hypothetical protein [Mycobacterium sp. DL592]|uniref:hypothetical protein n=1 Tax=Mycobacterium sp. DL592 TaxID=2675524 RepID=UPI00141ED990|nr:hypothetical protein [Mycobacterium sp. DL592]